MDYSHRHTNAVQRRARLDRDDAPPGKHTLTEHFHARGDDAEPRPGARAATASLVDENTALDHGLALFDPTASGGTAAGSHAPVQLREDVGADDPSADVHALAEAGTRGPGGALPHRDAIQTAFGHHDVSGIVAHVGGEAAAAADGMNALAYATGDHVAFAQAPDLHLAAHEAAHVVQQRAGVSLQRGVGESGDAYEQHADAVADRVVRGESAEALLDTMAPGAGTGARGVQMDDRQPLRERQIQFRIRVPETYDELREAIIEQLRRDLMSRTEVEQPDGSRAPIRRERTLVDASNLRDVYANLRPGGRTTLTARLIPGRSRYEQIVFETPNRDGGELPEQRIEGRPPQQQSEGGTPVQLPESTNLPELRQPEEIRDHVIGNLPGAAVDGLAFVLEAVALGALFEVISAVMTAFTIATELADLADNSGATTNAAKGFGVAFQTHRIAEYAFRQTTEHTNGAKVSYLQYLRGITDQSEAYGRLRQYILDATGDLNAQCTRAMQQIDAARNSRSQSGRRFTSERELSEYLLANASVPSFVTVFANNYNTAYRGSGSYAGGTPALR